MRISSNQKWLSIVLFLTLLCLCLGTPVQARQRWIRLTTDHFEMYTDNGEKQATNALQVFEQVRYFFLNSSKHPLPLEGKVRIVAFSSENDYKPYRLNAGAFAFFVPSHERDYIVMQDLQSEHHQTAVHEYTHLIVSHLKLDPPIWLNEGLAELYSSLEPSGKKAMVGRALPGRAETLLTKSWMDWNVLFQVDHGSPYYNVPDKMEIFYAQSWAATHMLALSSGYQPNFSRLFAAVSGGMPMAEALQKIYGKSPAEFGADVQKYVHQNTIRAAVYDVTLSKSDLNPDVEELSAFDKELALAELLSTKRETAPEARRRLMALEQQSPRSVEVQVSLGYLAWQENDIEDSRKHFGIATDAGLKRPKVLYDYALLLQGTSRSADVIPNLLSQVLAAQPENVDARLLLAGTLLHGQRYGAALSYLAQVQKVSPEHAFDYFGMLANARVNLHDLNGAKSDAQRALEYAKTDAQKQDMQQLLVWLEAAVHPAAVQRLSNPSAASVREIEEPARAPGQHAGVMLAGNQKLPRVKGVMKALECGTAQIRLRLHVDTGDLLFALPEDPKDVLIRNAGKPEIQLVCGALRSEALTVVYKPTANTQTAGVIAELVY